MPDNCRAYTLSDPDDPDYTLAYNHTHNDSCDRCLVLSSVVREVEEGLESAECSDNEKKEVKFITGQTE